MKKKEKQITPTFLNKVSASQPLKLQVSILILLAFLFLVTINVQAQFTQHGSPVAGPGPVSVSSDGNRIIAGDPGANSGVGAARVFEKNLLGNWVQEAGDLVGTGSNFTSRQGTSVAISGDGNYAIVGGPNDGGHIGAVWFFHRDNATTWVQMGNKLTGNDNDPLLPVLDQGFSVSMNYDGSIAIMSGYVGGICEQGAFWTFSRTGSMWNQLGSKTPAFGIVGGDQCNLFGYSISLSGDGMTAVVGAPGIYEADGRAYIYTRSGILWSLQGSLHGSNSPDDFVWQGFSVDISDDGSTVIIGGPYDNNNNNYRNGIGAAWIFVKNNSGNWIQQGNKLVGIDRVGFSMQGTSVSLSADGHVAMVGGPGDNGIGAAWVFVRSYGLWSQVGNKLVGTGVPGSGSSVTLSANACIAVSGGGGGAYIFECDVVLPVELTSFVSNLTGNDLQLSWTTSREINNSGFEIERTMMKGSPAEAGQWSKINFVSGHGNSNTLQNYSYEDKNLSSGKYNYRLKQIDYNGNFQFFNLNNEVIIGIPDKFEMSQNYPNPFNPTTKINYEIPDEGIVTLKIFDNNGREVMSILNELKSAGYYTAEVNLGGLSSGTYFYRIESGKFVNTKKMILLK